MNKREMTFLIVLPLTFGAIRVALFSGKCMITRYMSRGAACCQVVWSFLTEFSAFRGRHRSRALFAIESAVVDKEREHEDSAYHRKSRIWCLASSLGIAADHSDHNSPK